MFVMHGYTKIQVVLNPNPSQKNVKTTRRKLMEEEKPRPIG
jgi:hypothetical protein